MDEPILSVETSHAHEDIVRMGAGLTAHAIPTTGRAGFVPLSVMARRADGSLAAGFVGYVNWNWLQLDLVWIADEYRHQGLGSKMLAMLEAQAIERGCKYAHLDTFSFQARPFYERHGWEVFATLDDYPPGQSRIFMRKTLVA